MIKCLLKASTLTSELSRTGFSLCVAVCSVMGIIFLLLASLFVLSLWFVSKVHHALYFSLCFSKGVFVVHMSCRWECSCLCWHFANVLSWAAAALSLHSCIINNLLQLHFTRDNKRRRNTLKLTSALPKVRRPHTHTHIFIYFCYLRTSCDI